MDVFPYRVELDRFSGPLDLLLYLVRRNEVDLRHLPVARVTAQFQEYAGQHLVLMNADFPRSSKNKLPKDLQENNDQLAEQYNIKGSFPFTVLLNAEGKVLKSWEGLPSKGADNFIAQIKAIDEGKNSSSQ